MEILKSTKQNLNKIIKVLSMGGVVVFPTDTVYGFLALAENKKAVSKIFKIKKRPKTKPLPIFARDLKMAKELAEISPAQEKIIKSKWPGKFTYILKLKKIDIGCLSNLVVAKNNTVAIRIPKYKFLNDLLKKINKPLAQTSVNFSSQPPMSKSADIILQFGKNKNIDLIINAGNLKKSNPSAIIDLTGNNIKFLRK